MDDDDDDMPRDPLPEFPPEETKEIYEAVCDSAWYCFTAALNDYFDGSVLDKRLPRPVSDDWWDTFALAVANRLPSPSTGDDVDARPLLETPLFEAFREVIRTVEAEHKALDEGDG